MKPKLLISQKIVDEFGSRLKEILAASAQTMEVLPFTKDLQLSDAAAAEVGAAYYSRDVWEGTIKDELTPAARAFWAIVDRAPHLKWLAVYSAGTDQKRYHDAMKRGVRLTTSAGAQSESVGLAAVTGILALARNVPHWLAAQQKAEWAPFRGKDIPPDLPGQSALIVGTGYIGKVVARVLSAAGMKITGIRRNQAPLEHFERITPLSALDTLLPQCDWLVLAAPLVAETRSLIDRRRLALLKPTAGIANVARGELIDEAALAEALAAKRLRCAYLDVFTVEPLPGDSPLWRLPNVLISPHNAGASTGTYGRGVEIFLGNLESYLAGRPLVNEASPD